MEKFKEITLEAAKNFLEDNKVVDQFVENTVYYHVTPMPKFQMGVLGNQLCVNSNAGRESSARQYQCSEFWYQQESEASNRAQVLWKKHSGCRWCCSVASHIESPKDLVVAKLPLL